MHNTLHKLYGIPKNGYAVSFVKMSLRGSLKLASKQLSTKRKVYDFRSDTVTMPTPGMLEYMLKHADKCGDDVYQEDEATKELEVYVAKLTGHEAALFGATGTMTNQLGLRAWLRGALQSVLLDSRSHIYKYENAGVSALSQAGMTPVSPDSWMGHLTLDRVRANVIHPDVHCAQTRVVALENTLNGSIFPLDHIKEISGWVRAQKMPSYNAGRDERIIMHCDGARLWNASAETGLELKEYGRHFDSVSLCLSKGIGAPMGSVLVGPRELIEQARHFRKLFGGGWRQSGLMAKCALYAIENVFLKKGESGLTPMQQSHKNAKYMAERLSRIPGVKIANKVETSMVFVDVRDALGDGRKLEVSTLCAHLDELDAKLNEIEESVRVSAYGYNFDKLGLGATDDDLYVMRLVLHYQIDQRGCDLLISRIQEAVTHLKQKR